LEKKLEHYGGARSNPDVTIASSEVGRRNVCQETYEITRICELVDRGTPIFPNKFAKQVNLHEGIEEAPNTHGQADLVWGKTQATKFDGRGENQRHEHRVAHVSESEEDIVNNDELHFSRRENGAQSRGLGITSHKFLTRIHGSFR
jgi:hypothetical protein